ncbi:YciI family protein [Nocardia sp. NPDC058666]|uniref:YciI family protein n=1 Tax=Nocardia sp. NPDC058666 TaxID=3346587 RepID=UPI0036482358
MARKYLVMAHRTPQFDASVIEPHRTFLQDLLAKGRLQESGGFTNSPGGAYVILAESLPTATMIAHSDPLHTTGASELTIYEWEITVSV